MFCSWHSQLAQRGDRQLQDARKDKAIKKGEVKTSKTKQREAPEKKEIQTLSPSLEK